MNVVITGGAGFIGSQLGFYLKKKGHSVLLLDNLKFGYVDNLINSGKSFTNFVCVDVRDPRIYTLTKGADIIFHFAGISSLPECNNDPNEAYSCNVAGTANILEAARRNTVKKVIFSSTSAIYENETTFPSEESLESQPTLLYSLTKKHAEDLCNAFINMYDMNITILRFFNVYGPHMDYLRPNPPLVSYIIKCLLHKASPFLHSNGKQARDMIYVSDVLQMCELVMTHPKAKNDTFNVGSGVTTTVDEVYNLIAKAFDEKKIKPIYRDAFLLWEKYPLLFTKKYGLQKEILEHEVNKYTLASTIKSERLLGWKAKVTIAQGLKKTVAFAKKDAASRHI